MRRIAERFDRASTRADRRRRHRPHVQPRRAERARSTRWREHAGRRGLLLARSRTRPKGVITLLGVSGLLPRPRGRRRAPPLRGRSDRRAPRPSSDEEFLLGTLDTDEGARRLGEFGIGCNPGIPRHMKNTLFDEKMEGTVHLAIGTGFPQIGGLNKSAIHWDMVKELRERRADRARRRGRPGERRVAALDPRVARVRAAARRALARRAARLAGADPLDARARAR